MITSTLPPGLNSEIAPPAPSLTVTAFGIVRPASQFRLEASGLAWPDGQMVRKLEAVVLVTVTLSTTPSAPAGTPPLPVTWTSRVVPAPHGVPYGPTCGPDGRESWMRAGLSDVKPSPVFGS